MQPQFVLAVFSIITAIVAGIVFLQNIYRRLEDLVELNWKQLEVLAILADEREVMNGFVTRTGRILRPRLSTPKS